MLRHFEVRNFRNLRNIVADFGALNLFIGPNGAGKTSILTAIDIVRGFFEPQKGIQGYLEERGWEYGDLPNVRHPNNVITWVLEAELGPPGRPETAGLYRYEVSLSKRRYLYIGQERLTVTSEGCDDALLLRRKGRQVVYVNRVTGQEESAHALGAGSSAMAGISDAPSVESRYPELLTFAEWVSGFRSYLALDPRSLRARARLEHAELGPSGEHLPAVLAKMRKKSPDDFDRFSRRIHKLIPWVSDIVMRSGKWGWTELLSREGKHTLNSRQMSEGLLRLLAVTSFLYSQDTPTLLTFEEPENGVHPRLLGGLVQVFRDLTNLKPPRTCQVFASTHSPYVLDEFIDTPDEVYLLERGSPEDGARLRRLSEQDNIDAVRDAYSGSLGEAWFTGLLGAVPTGGQK